ncbi:MAG TPA: DUF4390 domain-containing protein [Chromatiales bacterium]|nr:DUF4390 domain-containing protein [Chromatiales bacterium]
MSPVRGMRAAVLCLALAAALPAARGAAGAGPAIQVLWARTTLADEVYHLDADIRYALGPAAEEALLSGVPLTFLTEVEVLRPRAWLWDARVARVVQRHVLRYHALSERFVLVHRNTGARRSFRTLARALEALGTIRGLPLLDRRLLRVGETYDARLRARLSVEDLPGPMRPFAYIERDWRRLRSAWYRWRLAS